MKYIKWGVLFLFVVHLNANAGTLTLWNFNSSPPDNNTGTGITDPAVGNGIASLVGGVTATFATSTTNDPPAIDNSGWNTTSYPSQGTGNKTAGVQFKVSTRGYSNIVVSFEQRPSNTASRYYRFQYTTNGTELVDGPVIQLTAANTFAIQTVPLGAIPGVDNNTNFAFRIVSEFEATALGTGVSNYLTTTASSYSAGGSVRFDLVTVSGDSSNPNNTPPTITELSDQLIWENEASDPIPFFINDLETLPEALVLTRTSSNTNLIPVENIVFTGTSDLRTLQVTPALNQFGSAIITVTVTDEVGAAASDSFVVTVVPQNLPPALSGLPHQSTLANTPTAALPFLVSDPETAADNLLLLASSSNPELVPASAIQFGGEGGNRTVTIAPAAGHLGTTLITISVTDGGGRSTNASFVLMVIPTASTLLMETFGYRDGSIVANSAGFWSTHGGISGQTQVASGKLDVRFSQSEDVDAPLLGGPYTPEASAPLYASFDIWFSSLPSAGGEYLAHFGSGAFRARVFATSTGAAAGKFRLGIANGTTTLAQLATDLTLSNTYHAVLRYNVASATSTLWVDPVSETDPAAHASDTVTAVTIAAFSFRQASGIGNSVVDNLRVGTSFNDVVPGAAARLQIRLVSGTAEISWPNSVLTDGFKLQSNAVAEASGWLDVEIVPAAEQDRKVVRLPGVNRQGFFRLTRP